MRLRHSRLKGGRACPFAISVSERSEDSLWLLVLPRELMRQLRLTSLVFALLLQEWDVLIDGEGPLSIVASHVFNLNPLELFLSLQSSLHLFLLLFLDDALDESNWMLDRLVLLINRLEYRGLVKSHDVYLLHLLLRCLPCSCGQSQTWKCSFVEAVCYTFSMCVDSSIN